MFIIGSKYTFIIYNGILIAIFNMIGVITKSRVNLLYPVCMELIQTNKYHNNYNSKTYHFRI